MKESQEISLKIFNDILRRIKELYCDAEKACDKYLIDVKFFYQFLAENPEKLKQYKRAISDRDDAILISLTSSTQCMVGYSRGLRDSSLSDSYLDEKSLAVMRNQKTTREAKITALVESIADKRISFRQFECWVKVVESLHGKLTLNKDLDVQKAVQTFAASRVKLPKNPHLMKKKAC